MPQLFTVRWPLFARLEAVVLFPAVLLLASTAAPVRARVDDGLVPMLSPLHVQLGVPYPVIFWFAVGLMMLMPFVVALVVADRVLTVRKGYAVLSLIAIAIWVGAASKFSDHLAAWLPDRLTEATGGLSFAGTVAFVAGITAFLLHLAPLWIGLQDDGDVAMHLVAAREETTYERARMGGAGRSQDLYYRQTAQFREWKSADPRAGLRAGPKNNNGLKILSAVTWIVVVLGIGAAYRHWNVVLDKPAAASIGSGKPAAAHESARSEASQHAPVPEVPPLPTVVMHNPNPGPSGAAPAMPLVPSTPATRPPRVAPQPLPHVISLAPMPAVQRPSDVSASGQAAGLYVGPNEAVAERGRDGGFAFDTIVNGEHVPMVFDTGASVVTLRSEDAERLGIPIARLNYSVKVKTANGTADVAPVMINTLTVGNITQRAVQALVAREGMLQVNLLGQSFLVRLAGYNVDRDLLMLKGR